MTNHGGARPGALYIGVVGPGDLGELRNGLVVRASDAIIAVGGSWGTLSEVALAMRTGVPVVSLRGWDLPAQGIVQADSPEAAVQRADVLASARATSSG